MSIKCMTNVWDNSKAKGSALLLQLAIADFADDNGYAYPATDTLANKIRMSGRQVVRIRQNLYKMHEIQFISGGEHRGDKLHVKVTPNGQGRVTIPTDKGDNLSAIDTNKGDNLSPKNAGRVTDSTIKGDKSGSGRVTDSTIKGDIAMSPDPSIDPSLDPSLDPSIDPTDGLSPDDMIDFLKNHSITATATDCQAILQDNNWPDIVRAVQKMDKQTGAIKNPLGYLITILANGTEGNPARRKHTGKRSKPPSAYANPLDAYRATPC